MQSKHIRAGRVAPSRRAFLARTGAWLVAPALGSAGEPGPSTLVDRIRWNEFLEGYLVDGCATWDRRRSFFVMQPDADPDAEAAPRRLLYLNADRPIDARRFVRGSVGFTTAGVAFAPSDGAFVVVGLGGEVFSYDGERGRSEAALPMALAGSGLRAAVHGVARVGRTVYVAGWPHRVWRRRSAEAWEALGDGFPADRLAPSTDLVQALNERRLRAIAGFGDDDLYAVGDGGEIWQWNGARWQLRLLPDAEPLLAACAGADRVFVADAAGILWAGRGERWTRVTDARPAYPVGDLAWFDGRLWCGMENGALQTLEGARLVGAGAPAEVSPGINHLDVAPDGSCLVAAGRWGAALHDGAKWQVLFGGTAPA